jgi:tRNA (guanine9-N1)-methyltransferase
MGQQLGASYNLNKLSCNPFSSIIFTGPPDKSLLETSLGMRMEKQGRGDWRKWKSVVVRSLGGLEGLNREQDDQEAICKKEQLVYLTADSDTTIESVEGDKVYIIGGLVDRNRHKVSILVENDDVETDC